ncbi:hypothetical protein GCM10010478_12800 [Streptomyces erythrogriseus]|uniref:Uncharacterized protein n=3 Tax=Streptomyces TaxID=1883 RepID=A0ABN3WH60_9ACTN|nr:phage portal protein [Streptomyces sp. BJ20]GGP65646.1 hypothetical protein GCM10010265_49910 [Streptomyces griseoincarnatus]GGT61873.1 hypothetical protein GCM10010287_40580 [Streptomyces variabilis]
MCGSGRVAFRRPFPSPDADELSMVYGGINAVTNVPAGRSFFKRPSQYRHGFLGRLARFFWGDPVRPGEQRSNKEHLPLASAIAGASANLLFGDMPSFKAEDEATQERLDEFVDDGLHAALREGAEVASALGGVYLRVVWDAEVRDHPWISVVHPDCAVPRVALGQARGRHLLAHDPGRRLRGGPPARTP